VGYNAGRFLLSSAAHTTREGKNMRDRTRYLTKAYAGSRDKAREKFQQWEARNAFGYDSLALALEALR
jgi:hypothetical protein